MTSVACAICAKHRGVGPLAGPLVHQDELVVVSLKVDGPPGYAFVETARHVGRLELLTPAEAAAVGVWTTRLAGALSVELDVEHVHTFIAGLGVDHVHQHVFVRPSGTPAEAPWWPLVPIRSAPDPDALAASLRAYLQREQGD